MNLYYFWSKHPGMKRKLWHCFSSYREARRWHNNWTTVDGRRCSGIARLLNGQRLVEDYKP